MRMSTMTIMTITRPMTAKQSKFIIELLSTRPLDSLSDITRRRIEIVRQSIEHGYPMTSAIAHGVISTLLGIRPVSSTVDQVDELNHLIARIPVSRYALPRRDGSGWDFFEISERRNGRRYVNQLIGSPSAWRRRYLPARLQASAVRAISDDPRAAAIAYATQHGRCAVCNAHLSNPSSIARSMGPVCAKRFN